jgi:carboxyl-terminal processing protease
MAISAALERTRTEQPGQAEHSRASEQCLRGIVNTLNRHSAYIDVREFREMQVGGPRLAGIGVELAAADQGARVVAALEGTPAERAGLKKGEILTRIDDRDLAGMPLSEVVRLLRGEPYSTVHITLRDSAASEPRTVTLEREVFQLESVRTRLIEPGLAFVRVTQFDTRAPKKIGDGLADAVLTSGSPLTGIVLDLRASTGGLLNVSVAIAAAFLPKNALIVYTTGRAADSSLRLYASPEYYVRSGQKDPYTRLPAEAKTARMVVLVSKTTAAGAEAVAGALQDHKRATIVGTNTFGKGFVETILPLEGGGALKITTASMHRPSGNALESAGVTPDVIVAEAPGVLPELTAEPNPDLGLEEAVRILRAQ